MPRRTNTEIEFELIDVSAKSDSTLSVSDKESFSDIEQIEQENISFPFYAQLEVNGWLLDGSYEIMPDEESGLIVGWWSDAMSGADGSFESPPALIANFTSNHSSVGLTLKFEEYNYPLEIYIEAYNGSTLVNSGTFPIKSANIVLDFGVENYTKLVMQFTKALPYHRIHMQKIDYGVIRTFTGDNEIMAATLKEEIDPISQELHISTLDFRLHSTDAEFSVLNPQGIYAYLQERQKLSIYEIVNGERRLVSTQYLEDWKNENENTFSMSSYDALGLVDGSRYMGGMFNGVSAETLLNTIAMDAGLYIPGTNEILIDIADELKSELLYGYIPICSHREAFQQVAFALGCAAITTGTEKIVFKQISDAPASTITRNKKFMGQEVSLRQFVTGVEVTEHTYTIGDSSELFNGELAAGQQIVTFNQPAIVSNVTGATLVSSDANYAVVNVTNAGNVTVTGTVYNDNKRVVGVYMANPPAGTVPKILTVTNATLVSKANSENVANRVYLWNQKRIQQNFSYIRDLESVGHAYDVETLYEQVKSGVMTSLETDLSKGYIGKATIIGG